MFEGWSSMDVGFVKAIACDLLNILFMVWGYKLAKFTKRKQKVYYENGGSSNVSWGDFFVWTVSLAIGLIVAWSFPVIFHEWFCDLTGFDYQIGLLAKLARPVLVLEMLYIVIKGAKVILPTGRVIIVIVMPVCLVYGHYWGD